LSSTFFLCRAFLISFQCRWRRWRNHQSEDPWRWCQSICFCASVAYSRTCQSIPFFFFFFFFVAPFSRWLKGLSRDLDRKMRKEELEDARALSRIWACNMIVTALKLVNRAWREREMWQFWNDPYDDQASEAWEEEGLLERDTESLCVCIWRWSWLEVCAGCGICAIKSAESWNFVRVLSSSKALIRNCAEFGQVTRMFDRNYWSIEPSSLPSAVHVNFLLAWMSVYDIASCIHNFSPAPDQSLFPMFNSEIQLSLHFKKGLLVLMHSSQFGGMYTCYLRFKGTILEGFKLFWTLAILIRVASNSLCNWLKSGDY
jgi:hypothetical protein